MIRSFIDILIPTLLISSPTFALALTGKVVSVTDCDTITIIDRSNRQHKIRLYGID
ncbi:thermonuclease family protein [Desulfosediminicola ganghwensis]|uniref:thermonuclease family protein n=1 Tax=Desulfosediminicola ganghwensis TaxID=2569540 RepID=UPI001294878B|nr:hypothetical protein [Desulfosediminicola ganghwensis]